jgi:archaellum component FlaC
VSPHEPRTWQAADAAARERLRHLEHESDRTRDTLHAIRSEAATVRFLAEKIAELAEDVKALATRVEGVSRHAVLRPSQTTLQVAGQYVSLVVAIIALYLAARG